VYDDEADADGDDQEDGAPDVFLAVTVDGQTLKASAAPPVTLAPRRAGAHARARQRQRPPSPAARTGLQMVRTILLALAAAILVSTISRCGRADVFARQLRAGLNQVQATQHLFNIQPRRCPPTSRTSRSDRGRAQRPPQDETFSEDPGAVSRTG